MDLLGVFKKKEGISKTGATNSNLQRQMQDFLKLAAKFQTTIIILVVGTLLAITSLRMMNYADPPIDENKIQENLNKFKQIRIDQKIVEKIKSLSEAQVSPNPDLDTDRDSPFSE